VIRRFGGKRNSVEMSALVSTKNAPELSGAVRIRTDSYGFLRVTDDRAFLWAEAYYHEVVSQFLIAYIEDSAADANLLKRAFLQMLPDAELLHFRDAEAAQDFFADPERSSSVGLAIVDVRLPRMSGKDLILWIRQQPAFTNLPVIAISSEPAFESIEEAQGIGATDFRLKPRTYNDYIDLVYSIQEHCSV
jgi:CheY-like chemotaxis protein